MSADLAQLAQQLTAADRAAQLAAAEKLAALGSEASPVAAALCRAAGASDDDVRGVITSALEDLGPPAPEQLAELQGLLAHAEADVRYWAATLLGRLEAAARDAVGALTKVLDRDAANSVRQQAAWALGKIGGLDDAAKQALSRAAAADDPRLTRLAKQALDG